MVRVRNPFFGTDGAGTLAETLVFQKAGRAHSVHLYSKPLQPGSAAQQNHQTLFGLLANRWHDVPDADRLYWSSLARQAGLSLYNAYLAYNLSRLNASVPSGLVAWWPCISPNDHTLLDLSTSGVHATWHGPAAHLTSSPYGVVPLFTPPQSYYVAGDLLLFEFPADFTVALAIHPAALSSQCFISKWTGVGSGSQWWLGILGGTIRAGVYTNDPSIVLFDSGIAPALDRWTSVAFTRQGSTGHLYIDGIDLSTKPCSPSVVGQNGAPLTIGDWNAAVGTWPYDGLLFDIRLYDRALSPAEVTTLAHQ